MHNMDERKGFRSNLGFLMAAIGSAVGLGNIWGFPFKMGRGGGFAFLLLYLLLTAVCGFVLLLSELALGRMTSSNGVMAYGAVSRRFRWVGWVTPVTAVLILSFYSALGGYCVKYLVLNVGSLLGAPWGAAGRDGATIFASLIGNQAESVIYGMIFLLLNLLIVMGGVSGGIERFCTVGMPALFVMLVIVIIRSCTLPGAAAGLRFMYAPNFEPLRQNFLDVLKTAGGQVFFSLSLAVGTMVTYGSYTDRRQSLTKNAAVIAACGALVGLLAGMAVLPAAFATGAPMEAMGGPDLLFITLQNVFGKMGPAGPIFGILFYALVTLAAASSSVSLLEVPVAYLTDRSRLLGRGDRRRRYTLWATLVAAVLCAVTCADGLGTNGLWVPFQRFFAGAERLPVFCESWLSFLDMIAEGLLMPLCGLLTCVMVGWDLGPDAIRREVELHGNRFASYGFYRFCVRYVTPLLMLFILWGQLKNFFGF
ncbi:MAG: sodium-dependent transporter [Ruminococcaceae bacterium]|jgi:NSS family neurotransmitter:Na+ symporter|nr:sodium-dependent transporter [Oscillospiraceae bacterium]